MIMEYTIWIPLVIKCGNGKSPQWRIQWENHLEMVDVPSPSLITKG